ncbi:phenylacetate-CoA oxygenase/reductase subunit PaaK [Sphingomonas oligophenolica]|uniref:2Fe-2S iron-sulfur cluster-binding protein n=1 Tax=Sphingomonas oligophenolica TaxID=301154 RepID=A0ABU9YB53_9SPHN
MSAKNDFHRLRVAQVRRETSDAVSILFDVPNDLADRFVFRPGQYLTLRTDIAGEDVRRNYSICASPLDGELRVVVKMLAGGTFSTFANETLKVGDEIEVLPAAGHFTALFTPDAARHYAAFAAGSGITPILSLIKTALMTEPESRFTLFYGNRMSGRVLFLEELYAIKNRYMGRLEVFHFLTMEEEDVDLFNGRLDRAKCDRILASLIDPAEVDIFFACGPEGMMEAAEQALLARGVPEDRILLERFSSAGSSTVLDEIASARAAAAAGRNMAVVLDGRKFTVPFDADQGNILDSVRKLGVPAPYACKGGVCATCRAKVVTGKVDMRLNYGLTKDELAQGYVLTCQATPSSDDVTISYDA